MCEFLFSSSGSWLSLSKQIKIPCVNVNPGFLRRDKWQEAMQTPLQDHYMLTHLSSHQIETQQLHHLLSSRQRNLVWQIRFIPVDSIFSAVLRCKMLWCNTITVGEIVCVRGGIMTYYDCVHWNNRTSNLCIIRKGSRQSPLLLAPRYLLVIPE